MFTTKDIYTKACHESKDLHEMTEDERLRLQAHLRKMYKDIEAVCDRHGLNVMLFAGSALGALRHQGFIPWDDDIDLLMPRKDYEKLVKEYASELPSNYKVYAPNCPNGAKSRFAKVVDTSTRFLGPDAEDTPKNGIFVDIFVLENCPMSLRRAKLKRYVMLFLMLVSSAVQEYKGSGEMYKKLMCSTPQGKRTYKMRRFIGWFFSFLSEDKWFNILDNVARYDKETGYVNMPAIAPKMLFAVPHPYDIYFPAKRAKFDDIEAYVPSDLVQHCEIMYGNWQWIPPVEERWQHFIKEIRFGEEN